MQVKSLQLKHVLHFSNITLNFDYTNAPITLILGNQGSGKTTLLRFCYQSLTWFAARQRDIRTAGLVMLDQDIMHNRLQSKVEIKVHFPEEIGSFPESSDLSDVSKQDCTWQMYKTLNSQGVGLSKVETQQLESMLNLYQTALKKDPLLGLPLIAYYPAERFVNEVNLISKNNPLIFQPTHAYELTAIPFTTFARFFEWFREISDIENAQSTATIQSILKHAQNDQSSTDAITEHLAKMTANVHAPSLQSFKDALAIIVPEVSDLYLKYHPKLQLMVGYQNTVMNFQQLPNSIRNWVALVGDVVRRLCILNPNSLFPCQEGNGILMIDAIDHQLDQDHASTILNRLHQAFPNVQIIATAHREELLEHAHDFQCLRLENKKLLPIQLEANQFQLEQIYAELTTNIVKDDTNSAVDALIEPITETVSVTSMFESIQQLLSAEQQQELKNLLEHAQDSSSPNTSKSRFNP
ncbi:AAA family ATPase [Acinetobacter wanghuae]|uniref:AAA family ATPase n=1 Tax=Acinetobacter wanghuae TaxID=2662362 RepID=A0A5Q0P5V4_9GAMM|nr:AAA family ATPase [Acinetobacter wanghuae]MQW92388.1 AAA family ATPase [Acinetobacter wanghuae]QGA12033.1 AAA family ATPase [Acinetobacter wanghuae]